MFSPEALREVLLARLGFSSQTRFVVALSGGADSVALLTALVHLGLQVRAVHIDHGLHPASGDWADFCAQLCARSGVACQVERVHVAGIPERGYEAAAREARYARLRECVAAGEVLLTGHHQDDQAETVLLQLLRGSGVAGLAAMPEVVPFGAGLLARPLLSFPRGDLRAYLEANDITWIEDDSNRDLARARNAIRHRVLPQLTAHWPAAIQTLARSARHAAQAQALLDELASQDLLAAVGDNATLVVSRINGLSTGRQANLIRHWLRGRGVCLPSEAQLGEILRVVSERPRSGAAVVQWPGGCVRLYHGCLTAFDSKALPHVSRTWTSQPWDLVAPLVISAAGVRLHCRRAVGLGLSLARVAGGPVSVRPRIGGEMCRLQGHRHRRALKKLLQENDVPPWERVRMPLLYVGDDLAAVADKWVCEPFAARASEPSLQLIVEDLASESCA